MDIRKLTEATPATLSAAPAGLSANVPPPEAVWTRIEQYIAHRWAARDVTWIVEGWGDFLPTLTPTTISSVQVWQDNVWRPTSLQPTPEGGYVCEGDIYHFVGVAGDDSTPPLDVLEAYKRLAEYMGEQAEFAAASSFTVNMASQIELQVERSPAWLAKALYNSGAADLLRKYRKV